MDIFEHVFRGRVIYPAKAVKSDEKGTLFSFALYVNGLARNDDNGYESGIINCSYYSKNPSQDWFALAIANVFNAEANPNAHLGESYKSVEVLVSGKMELKKAEKGYYVNLKYVRGSLIDAKVSTLLSNIFSNKNQQQTTQAPPAQTAQVVQPVRAEHVNPSYAPSPHAIVNPVTQVHAQMPQQINNYQTHVPASGAVINHAQYTTPNVPSPQQVNNTAEALAGSLPSATMPIPNF